MRNAIIGLCAIIAVPFSTMALAENGSPRMEPYNAQSSTVMGKWQENRDITKSIYYKMEKSKERTDS